MPDNAEVVVGIDDDDAKCTIDKIVVKCPDVGRFTLVALCRATYLVRDLGDVVALNKYVLDSPAFEYGDCFLYEWFQRR